MVGQWVGEGRAATSSGEAPVRCDVESKIVAGRLSMSADCSTQGQSATIAMLLSYNEASQRFTGEMLAPLNYMRGQLYGQIDRGDIFLRLSARDGSVGQIVVVGVGGDQLRLLVTTIVDGRSVTVLDLPLSRQSG
ncbi:MAG: hypothetical protein AAF739_14610 [Pseudomonadota bacterium]